MILYKTMLSKKTAAFVYIDLIAVYAGFVMIYSIKKYKAKGTKLNENEEVALQN